MSIKIPMQILVENGVRELHVARLSWRTRRYRRNLAVPGAVAAPIWREDLLQHCQAKSGVVTVRLREDGSLQGITVRRRVKANPEAKPLSNSQLVNIARLASIRMWEAYRARDAAAAEARQARMVGVA